MLALLLPQAVITVTIVITITTVMPDSRQSQAGLLLREIVRERE
ncbi:MAG TPA: hypothetical protein VL346_06020 [Acidobacteriaceae bacterium]|nr:hypothetical protein [Acidobacteriaceae bacterium]